MSEGKTGFARRLNAAFDGLDIPPKQRGRYTALARLFSVSPVAARDWCEGNSYPSVDKLLLIVDTVRCGADWLLFGRGAPGSPPSQGTDEIPAKRPHNEVAGDGAAQSPDQLAISSHKHETWLQVGGDAMAPTLLPGDWVAYTRLDTSGLEDGLHALLPLSGDTSAANRPLLRRLLRRLDDRWEVSCDNERYAEKLQLVARSPDLLSLPGPDGPQLRVLGRLSARRQQLA